MGAVDRWLKGSSDRLPAWPSTCGWLGIPDQAVFAGVFNSPREHRTFVGLKLLDVLREGCNGDQGVHTWYFVDASVSPHDFVHGPEDGHAWESVSVGDLAHATALFVQVGLCHQSLVRHELRMSTAPVEGI